MPAECHLDGDLLTLVLTGLADNDEIERALSQGAAQVTTGTQVRLLWDSRRAVTLVSADDVTARLGMVASLAERGIVIRLALLAHASHSPAVLSYWSRELPKALPGLPVGVFVNEGEAVTWLESGEPKLDRD